uniref:Uncharacterized protein n=1 Tax=Mycena chlorophos TaxID=658473 RepID=A0ABQ0LIK6_MYCCL|nr:predicted protein [Mycena chlorophos]
MPNIQYGLIRTPREPWGLGDTRHARVDLARRTLEVPFSRGRRRPSIWLRQFSTPTPECWVSLHVTLPPGACKIESRGWRVLP